LPIIAMTAHATMEERKRCLDSGMNDHVSKPIEPVLLFETLGRYYKPRPASPSLLSSSGEGRPAEHVSGPDDLPSVEGLDTKDGLGRVVGNRNLYLKLLRQFVQQQGAVPAQIAEALARNDLPVAERLAHTVRGVGGTLGARAVQNAAAKLEKTIAAKTAAPELAPVLQEFQATLDDFVSRLRAALPQPQTTSVHAVPAAALDAERAKQVITEMISHLNNFDTAAGDCLEANQDVFRTLLPGEAFAEFEQQVSGFAFEDALSGLQHAAQEKGLLQPGLVHSEQSHIHR
jgi:two-component system, sensor histidine kinase and response regulator